jgi:CheY-like chemotaxis protein
MEGVHPQPMVILLVEDNPADVFMFKEALEGQPSVGHSACGAHGQEALRFLHPEAPFADTSRPDVIVLDLNLPIMNGPEMPVQMMSEPELQSIPVAVLTTSTSERCVCDLCPPGHCLYFTKTDDFKKLQVRQIVAHATTATSQA